MTTQGKKEDSQDIDVPMGGTSSPREIQNALYARCASEADEGKTFSQDDLLEFGIVPDNDVTQLLLYTKQLTKDGLFKLMARDGKAYWRVVKKDDAAKCVFLQKRQSWPESCLPFLDTNRCNRTKPWYILTLNRLDVKESGADCFVYEPTFT